MPRRENKKAKTNEEILAQLNNAQRANAALKADKEHNVQLQAQVGELRLENNHLKAQVKDLDEKIADLVAGKGVAAQA